MAGDGGKLSLREAATAFDVSRPTLTKALASGKLSGERDDTGAWRIDPAELARVYAPRKAAETPPEAAPAGAELVELRAALEVERAKREAAERLAEERRERIEDLRRLLPAPAGEGRGDDRSVTPPRRRWWPWSRD